MSELEKLLKGMAIEFTAKDMPSIPARGFGVGDMTIKAWRVVLTRTTGRGKDAKRLRLVATFIADSEDEPPAACDVVECLVLDAIASEQTQWEFAQAYCGGVDDEETERLHRACKKVGGRARRFFSASESGLRPEVWGNIVRLAQGLPPLAVTKPEKGKVRKSA